MKKLFRDEMILVETFKFLKFNFIHNSSIDKNLGLKIFRSVIFFLI